MSQLSSPAETGAIRLDGKALAERVREEVRARVAALGARGVQPGLAVLKVGDDPASAVYVANKRKTCETLGIRSFAHDLPATTEESRLIDVVAGLNEDTAVHGILVQLPLPRHIRAERVLDVLSPAKDVDGLHVVNAGRLLAGREAFVPCTPAGVMRLLREYSVPIEGSRALVIGRSILVGKPMAVLLLAAQATVTIAHSKTRELESITREADIVVAAAGQPALIGGQWIRPGAAVVDVGIHRGPEGSLLGDVRSAEVGKVAGWLSPVPGGVGPMTVAMLMDNAVWAAERALRPPSHEVSP